MSKSAVPAMAARQMPFPDHRATARSLHLSFRRPGLVQAVRLALAGMLCAAAAEALAQGASDDRSLPAVRVTADRPADLPADFTGGQVARGARLGVLGNTDFRNAPFSVSSYTAQMAQDHQAATIADVLRFDPAVRLSGHGGDLLDSFFIRGFPIGDQNSGEVAFDGVYGVAPNYRVMTEYAERIEVIKGPAALLYGMSPAGSIGGSINIVPKRAGIEDLSRLTASYGSTAQWGGHLDLSRRFGHGRQFGIRFNGSHRQGDTAVDHQTAETTVGALALDYQGERLRATLDLIDQREDVDAPLRRPFLAGPLPDAPDGRRNVTQKWEWFKTEDQSILLRAEYDLNDTLQLFADAGGGDTRVDRLFGNPLILNAAGDTTTTPQRFRFDVDRSTASAGLRVRFASGALRHAVTLQASSYRERLGRSSINGTAFASNLYDPVDRPRQVVAAPAGVPKVSDSRLDALVLSDTLSLLGDRLQFTVGARHQQVESDSFAANGSVTASYDEDAITPMMGVVYKPWRQVSLYANAIQGLSRGDTAPASAANAGETFAPYKSMQYEIGAKFEAGGMAATVALFQIRKPSAEIGADNVFAVDGEQRNRGIEFSVFGEAARGLRLLGGLTLIDAEITRSSNAAVRGNDAVGVAPLQASLGAEWDLPWMAGLTLSGNIIHTGKQYVDRANTARTPSWTTLDLGARYRTRIAGKNTVLRANLRNVFDRNYWSGVSQYSALVQGAPRSLLLSASVEF